MSYNGLSSEPGGTIHVPAGVTCQAGSSCKFVAVALLPAIVWFVAGLALSFGTAAADGYRLDTGDILRVAVFGEATYPLEVSVDDSGSVTLPLLGEIVARGKSTAGLVATITDLFRERQLIRDPFVQVAILEYRPFFISGSVVRPGAYPYRPGLTIRHALAIAGGFRAISIGDRDPALTMSDLKSNRVTWLIERFRYQVRRERLRAELADNASFTIPAEIPAEISPRVVSELIESEEAQMGARRADLDRELASIGSQLEELRRNAGFLHKAREKKEMVSSHQLQEVETARTLRAKGLATQSTLLAAETAYDNSLADTAQMEAESGRRQQEMITFEERQSQIKSQRRMEIIAQIQEANVEIAKAETRIAYISEQLAFIATYGEQRSLEDLHDVVRFTVHRAEASDGVPSNLRENGLVHPGDVIEVSIIADRSFYEAGAGVHGAK